MPNFLPGHHFSPSRKLKQVHVSRMKAYTSTQCGPIFLWNSANLCARDGSSKDAKPGKNQSNDSFTAAC